MEEKVYYLDFMYDKISVPKMVMLSWLKFPEFSEQIKEKIDENASIDNGAILNIIEKVYFPQKKMRDELGSKGTREALVNDGAMYINHALTRKGLRHLSKALFNDENHWLEDYERFLKEQEQS